MHVEMIGHTAAKCFTLGSGRQNQKSFYRGFSQMSTDKDIFVCRRMDSAPRWPVRWNEDNRIRENPRFKSFRASQY